MSVGADEVASRSSRRPTTVAVPSPATTPMTTASSASARDLEPGTLLAAYRGGLFPMPVGRTGRSGGGRPTRAACSRSTGCVVSRSLRRSLRRYEVRVDTAFEQVMRRVRRPRAAPDGWITEPFVAAYARLHDLGWAHSVECWTRRRAGRRPVRRRDRRVLRRGVDVPAQARRVEGRARRARATGCATRATGCSTCSGRRRTSRTLGVVEMPRPRYVVALARTLLTAEGRSGVVRKNGLDA